MPKEEYDAEKTEEVVLEKHKGQKVMSPLFCELADTSKAWEQMVVQMYTMCTAVENLIKEDGLRIKDFVITVEMNKGSEECKI